MNINRHNYEEYFILYVDNELSAEERRMVEDFVMQHPDLKEELDTLQQYKLVPDTDIVFEGKEELMKENGQALITPGNYEEWLSLLVDNELSADQKLLVEKFTASNPSVQKELALLQKTKLQPEPVIFPYKNLLYRKEEKTRRIAPFYWRAAAAVLIIALGISAVLVLNKKPSGNGNDPEIAVKKPEQPAVPVENNSTGLPQQENIVDATTEKKNNPVTAPLAAEARQPAGLPVNNKNKEAVADARKKTVTPANKTMDNTPLVNKNEEPVMADNNNKFSNNLPQPLNNPNIIPGNNKPQDALAVNNPPVNTSKPQNTINPDVTSAAAQPSDIVQASYKENSEMLEQTDGKKNKNRGIFRKIARTFEKRTNIDPTDDNRLLVAGLAIKLK